MHTFKSSVEEAINRFNKIYKTSEYNEAATKRFLDSIRTIVQNMRIVPRFSFYLDGASAVFTRNQQEVTVEYDFDEPDFVFVSKFIDETLHIKDASLDNLIQIFGDFL